jgi:hypothetical protein
MFVTRQFKGCRLHAFRMAVPVSARNNYLAVVRHELTLCSNGEPQRTITCHQRQGGSYAAAHKVIFYVKNPCAWVPTSGDESCSRV